MKILLLNDNPVVTKLVTLSAQKTDDEVVAAHSLDEVPEGAYDLLVIDDALYDEESYAALQEKVSFKKSLFICSRENDGEGNFTATIKKPFLPTDMVELLTTTKRTLDEVKEDEATADEELLEDLELEGLDDLDDIDDLDIDLEDLDDEPMSDLDALDESEVGESVLDDEEAQKVKELLDETQDDAEEEDIEYDLALDLEDEADADISEVDPDLAELGIADEVETNEEQEAEELEEISFDEEVDLDLGELELDEELGLDEELAEEEETIELEDEALDIADEDLESVEDIETQIQDAVEELSDEDLESEVDEETLLDIANSEIDSFANLSSKDLKAALGEEIEDEEVDELPNEESVDTSSTEEIVSENRGVESLKALLKTLSDESVAASLKGAKITINISFED